jgi:hypothetical protein
VTAMNRWTQGWVQALAAPDRGHAADDLVRIVAEVDEMWTRLSRIHDLIARADGGEVRVYAEIAQDAVWRLQERLDSVVTDLRREEWGWEARRG